MFSKQNLSSVKLPALTFLLITVLVMCIQNPPTVYPLFFLVGTLIYLLIPNLLWQFFAYLSCWAFVLRRGKPQNYVWINYFIWIVIANLGAISEILVM